MPTEYLIACLKIMNNFKKNQINKKIPNCSKKNLYNIYKEIYKRLITPFYLPVLILISFLLIVSSKEHVNYPKYKYLIFFLGVIIIIFSESILKFIDNTINKNLFIFSLPIIIFMILYISLSLILRTPKIKTK